MPAPCRDKEAAGTAVCVTTDSVQYRGTRDIGYHVVAISCSMQEGELEVRAPVRGVWGVFQGGSLYAWAPSRVRHMHVGSPCHACHYIDYEAMPSSMPWGAIDITHACPAERYAYM